VRDDGTISLPYIGKLQADDADPDMLAARIRQRLKPLSQSPQVQVAITQSVQSVAYVSGAISKPGRISLTAARERLLDVLAIAGGAQSTTAGADGLDLDVHLVRGDKAVSVRLGDLRPEDVANLVILPGDRIELRRAARTYTAFGATEHVSQILSVRKRFRWPRRLLAQADPPMPVPMPMAFMSSGLSATAREKRRSQ
jgi:polysaccharide export outer membrane protein